jgi:hypothetical protein
LLGNLIKTNIPMWGNQLEVKFDEVMKSNFLRKSRLFSTNGNHTSTPLRLSSFMLLVWAIISLPSLSFRNNIIRKGPNRAVFTNSPHLKGFFIERQNLAISLSQFQEHSSKLRSIPLSTSRPTFEEISKVWTELTEVTIGRLTLRKEEGRGVSEQKESYVERKVEGSQKKEEEGQSGVHSGAVLADRAPPRIVYPKPRERKEPII